MVGGSDGEAPAVQVSSARATLMPISVFKEPETARRVVISGRRVAGEDGAVAVQTYQDHIIALTLCLWSHSR